MLLSSLLALATGVYSLPPQHRFGRVVIRVRHPGPTRQVKVSIRTKQTLDTEWEYFRDLSTYPRIPRTSPLGRRVTISLPPQGQLKRFTQVCTLLEPEETTAANVAKIAVQSCANVRFRKE
jgi:hypothetical protein